MAEAAVVETAPSSTPAARPPSGPQRLVEFLKDTRQEMRKVVTPTRDEVRNNTVIVIGTVFVFAAYFALIDNTLGRLIDRGLLKLTGH
jgi:preprotein translocase subunit SecE